MAAGFVALNETFGTVFDASRAEAATPAMAQERANALKDQFIMDMHTHFLRDDTRLANFVRSREAVGKAGWNPALVDKPQTLDDLKFNNYFKEIYLDSDTKIALISSSPSEIPRDWFLTNEMMIEARDKVNKEAGSRRMFAHAIFTPGWDGWLEHLEGVARSASRNRSRAIPSATTPTRTRPSIPGGWTTRRSPTRPTSCA